MSFLSLFLFFLGCPLDTDDNPHFENTHHINSNSQNEMTSILKNRSHFIRRVKELNFRQIRTEIFSCNHLIGTDQYTNNSTAVHGH